jgi:hypothetical protein
VGHDSRHRDVDHEAGAFSVAFWSTHVHPDSYLLWSSGANVTISAFTASQLQL